MKSKLIPANRSWLRQALSPIVPLERWWMTYRLPFQRHVRITYPPSTPHIIAKHSDVRKHEEVHAEWFATWWGPWVIPLLMVLPLPVLLSGRWLVERPAYLADIRAGRHTVESAVEAIWSGYGWPWPRSWMRRWFEGELGS